MPSSFVQLLLHAALVTVAPSVEENCPSSTQVDAALQTHAPALVLESPIDNPNDRLTLLLSPSQNTGETSFFLLDRQGKVRLYRSLPPPVGKRSQDCAALADTVALIVDRFFAELQLPMVPAKPSPPLPITSALDAASPPAGEESTEARPATTPFTMNPKMRIGLELEQPFHTDTHSVTNSVLAISLAPRFLRWGNITLGADFGLGLAWPNDIDLQTGDRQPSLLGTVTVYRAPMRFTLWLARQLGRSEFRLGARSTVEVFHLRGHAWLANQSPTDTSIVYSSGLEVAYFYSLSQRLFARVTAVGNLAYNRYIYQVNSDRRVDLFSTPRYFAGLSLGFGVQF